MEPKILTKISKMSSFSIVEASKHRDLFYVKRLAKKYKDCKNPIQDNEENEYLNQNCVNNSVKYAAEYGHLDVLEILYENDCITEEGFKKAIEATALYGQLEIITFLLEKFPNYKVGDRAIECASQYGHLKIVKLLHKFGAPISDWTISCSLSRPKILKFLIIVDVPLNFYNEHGTITNMIKDIKKQIGSIVSEYIGPDISSVILDYYADLNYAQRYRDKWDYEHKDDEDDEDDDEFEEPENWDFLLNHQENN